MVSDTFSSEEELLSYIKKNIPQSDQVSVPIGDDAAVVSIPKGEELVATTDALVEDVHFKRDWITPEFLGQKAMRVNTSDCAAMGAIPRYALMSLILPTTCQTKSFICELNRSIQSELTRHSATLVGGNISRGEKLSISITLLSSARKNSIITRSGSTPGDLILVTGNLGLAACELYLLQQNLTSTAAHMPPDRTAFSNTLASFKRPGLSKLVSAGIDISDGFTRDLARLCQTGGVGAFVYEALLPTTTHTREIADKYQQRSLEWVLYGGEDYELLFTVKPELIAKVFAIAADTDTPVSIIGCVQSKQSGMQIQRKSGLATDLESRGWDHFKI